MSHKAPASRVRQALKIAVVVLWLFAVVTAYFWAHKPFDTGIAAGLGRSLLSVAVWLAVTWLGAALGRWICGRWLSEERPIARLALSAGIGLGVLSLLVLGLGLAGLLRPAVAWALVLLLGVLLRRDLRGSLVDLRAVRLPRPTNGFQRWMAVYAGISLLLTFLAALAPPSGWDTLVYHLTGPRLFVESGRVSHAIDLPYLGFPQLGEMQFTLGLLLLGEGVAPLLHFGYGLLALAITGSLTRRASGKDATWFGVAILLSVPTLLSLMSRAYVDVTLLFYTSAAFYGFLRWREARALGDGGAGKGWLLMTGLLCGFCGGVKYTAIAVPFALALSVAWVSRHDGMSAAIRRLAFLAGGAVVAVLPWLLENWLTAGNPVYPFFIPDGVYWDEWRGWWYDRPGTGLAATAPWRLLIAPLEATILGVEGTSRYDATIGPLLLASVALLPLVWRLLSQEDRAVVGHAVLFVGVNYVLWLNGLARSALLYQTRLLLPVFGVVAVLGGLALDRVAALNRPQLNVGWLVRAVVGVVLALLLFSLVTGFIQANPLPAVLGLETRDDYLTRRLGWHYVAIQTINQDLPPDAIVLFLWEPRAYHCRAECWPDALLDRWLHTTHVYGQDAGAIAAAWRAQGISHVLLHRAGYQAVVEAGFDPVTKADQTTLETLLSREMVRAGDFGEAYELYAFPRESGP